MNVGVILAIAVGGALGSLLRYGAQLLWPARGAHVPRAVLLVNIVGSVIAGAFLALGQWDAASGTPAMAPSVALIVMTGFCGGLTTFSTFAVETVELATAGNLRPALANVGLNLLLGLGGAALAYGATNAIIIASSSPFGG
jgi:CrcB protein